jgi:hypothetical protein
MDDSDSNKVKFEIGDGTKYLKWDGSALLIRGSLNADDLTAGTITALTVQTAASGKRMLLNSSTNEAEFYGDRGWHS